MAKRIYGERSKALRRMLANQVVIHYCYPSSEMAEQFGKAEQGGFYVTVGCLPISPLFREVQSAEGFCRNNSLTWEPHAFPCDNRIATIAQIYNIMGS